MPTARSHFAAATMNGKIYVAGGWDSSGRALSNVECYDPINDAWSVKGPMKYARRNFSIVELNGKMYAIGFERHIERYDPNKNEWTVVCEQIKKKKNKNALDA